ncbi:MAG: hypothetical protein IGS23_22175 [Rivularia sp. T60_A2020_040]|nr:hypothetical protein [Rivularia sp. T60_A2020_040]
MNNPEYRVKRELAPEVFQLASELYAQKQQEYSLEELISIGKEAEIPAEFIQQAVDVIQSRQTSEEIAVKNQHKYPKLKMALLGVLATATTLGVGGWVYGSLSPQTQQLNSKSSTAIMPKKGDKKESGNVERYLLNKQGLVDGFLLNNGKQIKFASHMSEQIVDTIKPGDFVEVVGKMGTPTSYGQEIDARLITNAQTKQTIGKQPKSKGKKKPDFIDVNSLKIDDTVQHWLVNGKGEIKGAILTSGTQVHFSKALAKNLNQQLKSGSQIKAEGVGKETPYGYVIEVISAKIDGELLPNGK